MQPSKIARVNAALSPSPALSAAPSAENVRDAVEQLHSMYEKNAASPSVKDDLKLIFG